MTSVAIPPIQQALIALIADVVSGSLGVDEFCHHFEILYNRDNEPSSFEPWFRAICEPLFDVVVWYSPYPEERAIIPNYLDEDAVLKAARKANAAFASHG